MLTKSLPIAYRNLDRPSCMSKLIDFQILSIKMDSTLLYVTQYLWHKFLFLGFHRGN